jgi:hypothetical protein
MRLNVPPMTLMYKGDDKDGNDIPSDTSSEPRQYLRGSFQTPEGLFRQQYYEVA